MVIKVVALLREKWMAIPHPRLNRLRLLVPCPSSEKDKEVVVDDGIQEQPRFLSCLGMNKMEVNICSLFYFKLKNEQQKYTKQLIELSSHLNSVLCLSFFTNLNLMVMR